MKKFLITILFLASFGVADAAVTLQGAPVTANSATDVLSQTYSVTVAAGTDTVMAVSVAMENTDTGAYSVSSVTFNADALTLSGAVDPASWSRAEIWYRVAPAVVTGNVVVTLSNADKVISGTYVANNVNQTTPLRTAVTASATTGTGTGNQTVASVATDDLVFDSLSIDSTGHAGAVGADQTERWDLDSAAGGTTGLSSTQLGSAGGVMSWTWTSSAPWSYVTNAFVGTVAAGGTPAVSSRKIKGGGITR